MLYMCCASLHLIAFPVSPIYLMSQCLHFIAYMQFLVLCVSVCFIMHVVFVVVFLTVVACL